MPRNASTLGKIAVAVKREEPKGRPQHQHQHLQLALGNESISYLTEIKRLIFPHLYRESSVRTTLNRQGPGPQHWKPAAYEESAKAPFIVFGDAMFGRKNLVHIPGKKHGVVGVLWKALKRKEREGKLVAIPIDEYYTSQVNMMTVNER